MDVMEFIKKNTSIAIIIFFFILSTISFYFLVFDKIELIKQTKNELQNSNQRIIQLDKATKEINKTLKIHLKKVEEFKKNCSSSKNQNFLNFSEFTSFINTCINHNFLQINSIARPETLPDTSKTYTFYSLNGKLQNILDFISEVENYEKQISFLETPFKITINKISCFEGKIATDILNLKEDKISTSYLDISKYYDDLIKDIVTLNVNKKNYILMKYSSGKKIILLENQIIEKNNTKYQVKIIKIGRASCRERV